MVQTIKDGDVSGFDDFDSRYVLGEKGFGIKRDALKSLPVINVSPFVTAGTDTQRLGIAQEIRKACIDVGFFYLTGHGFTASELNRHYVGPSLLRNAAGSQDDASHSGTGAAWVHEDRGHQPRKES